MISIRNLTKSFNGVQVLRPFNEDFQDGEFITLLGPSGCGKTTILRLIAGFETPTTGEIRIDGKVVSGERTFLPPEKRDIGMVFQSYAVWPHMNVFDNVAYPLKMKHLGKEEIRTRVERILETVHLSQYRERLPSQLSGGQQQRIALARALVAEPKLLLLDEPLSNLDAKLRESMRFEIRDITRVQGISVVYVTHDQTEAMAMSDRIILINSGEVQQIGTPEEIYNRPASPFVADFLGKVEFFRGMAAGGHIHMEDWNTELLSHGEQPSGIPEQVPGYDRDGPVQVAIRPENIRMTPQTSVRDPQCENTVAMNVIPGTLERMTYLGDVTDCRVRVGRALVRVIAEGAARKLFREGDPVHLEVLDFILFPDDGSTDSQLRIRT